MRGIKLQLLTVTATKSNAEGDVLAKARGTSGRKKNQSEHMNPKVKLLLQVENYLKQSSPNYLRATWRRISPETWIKVSHADIIPSSDAWFWGKTGLQLVLLQYPDEAAGCPLRVSSELKSEDWLHGGGCGCVGVGKRKSDHVTSLIHPLERLYWAGQKHGHSELSFSQPHCSFPVILLNKPYS